jgi:hypothetical protein
MSQHEIVQTGNVALFTTFRDVRVTLQPQAEGNC